MSESVVILCAMPIEAQPIAKVLGLGKPQAFRGGRRWEKQSQRIPVTLLATGIGSRMAEAVQEIEWATETYVIIAGFSGGLAPELRVGDVLRPGSIHAPDAATITIDGPDAPLLTVRKPPLTAQAKHQLHEEHSAAVVDMETFFAAEALRERGVTPGVIRVVSDTADQDLPPQVMDWLHADGTPRMARALMDCLRQPSLTATLNRLREHSAIAGNALAMAVKDRVDSLDQTDHA